MNEEWIKRVVEEFKETIIFETEYEEGMRCHHQDAVNWLRAILEKNQDRHHHQLQKAREEERERIRKVVNDLLPIMWSDDAERHASNIRLTNNLNIILKALDHSELDQDNKYKINLTNHETDTKHRGDTQH